MTTGAQCSNVARPAVLRYIASPTPDLSSPEVSKEIEFKARANVGLGMPFESDCGIHPIFSNGSFPPLSVRVSRELNHFPRHRNFKSSSTT
jgi:hypothetical protein